MPREGRRSPTLQFDLFAAGFRCDPGSKPGPEGTVLARAEPPGFLWKRAAQPTRSHLPSAWHSSLSAEPMSSPPGHLFPVFNQRDSASSSRPSASIASQKLSSAFLPPSPSAGGGGSVLHGPYSPGCAGSPAVGLSLRAVSDEDALPRAGFVLLCGAPWVPGINLGFLLAPS